MFIVPKEGSTVRDPVTRAKVPAEGMEVPRNSYWTRVVLRGDAEETPHPDGLIEN